MLRWDRRQQAVIDEVLRFRRDRVLAVAAARTARVDNEDEAYGMQDWLATQLDRSVAGWKVGAFFDPSVRKMLGLSQPFFGRIFTSELRRSPAMVAPDECPGCHVEAELALQIGEDIPVEGAAITPARLARLVSACHPVFEIVTSSWDDRRVLSGFDHVADNGGCGGLVLGAPIPDWRKTGLRGQTVELEVGGQIVVSRPIDVDWPDVLRAAAWLVNRLKTRGVPVRAGQIIATGTLTGLNAVAPGQVAAATFGAFAKVQLSIASAYTTPSRKPMDLVIPAMQRPVPLKEQIYHNLLLMFTTMDFGQRVVERDLTELLGVSRTPVREALARLAADGYIVSTGRGYCIPMLSVRDVENLTEIRALLEPAAARQGAMHDSAAGLDTMAAALADAQAAHEANDPIAFNLANRRFRAGWKERISNELLLDALAKTMSSLQLVRHRVMREPVARQTLMSSDQELLEAFRAHDVQRAVASRDKQIQEMSRLLIANIPARPRR